MGYKQIVFDVDGTLIDTEYAVIHSLQDTIRAINGKIISDKELTFALGITGENALQRLGVSDIASALSMWYKNMEKYRDTITVFHGIKELLETISELKLGIGIVTSKTHEEFRSDFQKFDISSCDKYIMSSSIKTSFFKFEVILLLFITKFVTSLLSKII